MRKWIILAAVFGIAILVWSNRPALVPDASTRVAATPLPDPSPTVMPSATPSVIPSKSVVELAPTREEVRSEVEKNPHGPSTAVVGFSVELAPRLEAAMKSPEAAEKFTDELQDCIEGKKLSGRKAFQALCLLNLRRLAAKSPTIRARATAISERADPEVRRLAE